MRRRILEGVRNGRAGHGGLPHHGCHGDRRHRDAGFAVRARTGDDVLRTGPDPAAQLQIAGLTSAGDKADAALVAALASTSHAVWITGGSPNDARVAAQKTVNRAAGKNQIPVLALYDIPGRDCSGYSAGGATDLVSYEAWIDGVAAGIGDQPAVVILEPDSLGLLPEDCPNQHWDGGPATNWDGAALSPYLVWQDVPYSGQHADLAWNTTGIESRWASMLGSTQPTTHFVIDTSRAGHGPWQATTAYPDKQDWCNPPGRGLGPRPTTDTGSPLADAFLWVKVPGESDGSCNRGIPGATTDPEWGGIVDPAAGTWFPEAALQLAQLASPPLAPCRRGHRSRGHSASNFPLRVSA